MDYFSIDSILNSSVKVPCFFKADVPGYGFLGGRDDTDILAANTKVDLQFWAAEQLAINELAELEVPKFFGRAVRNDLQASSRTVDVRRLSPHFFGFGAKLIALIDDSDLALTLMDSMTERLLAICEHTQSGPHNNPESQHLVHTLDDTERELYRVGHESSVLKKRWSERGRERLHKSRF